MHLEILLKSINYLSKERIEELLSSYKTMKEQKRKEEAEKLLIRSQMKKARGRSNSKRRSENEPEDTSAKNFGSHNNSLKDEASIKFGQSVSLRK